MRELFWIAILVIGHAVVREPLVHLAARRAAEQVMLELAKECQECPVTLPTGAPRLLRVHQ